MSILNYITDLNVKFKPKPYEIVVLFDTSKVKHLLQRKERTAQREIHISTFSIDFNKHLAISIKSFRT